MYPCEQVLHPAAAGHLEAGIELGERLENEAALVQARVRDAEPGLVDLPVAVQQEVEVERARPVLRRALALATEAALDLEQPVEQLAGGEGRHELECPVEEGRLLAGADELGLVEARDGDHRDPGAGGELGDGRTQGLLTVAEVRSERDVGPHGASLAPERRYSGRPVRVPLPIAVVAALICTAAGGAAAAPMATAGEPLQGQEWWLGDVGADRATPPGPGVPLTIVDTGVDLGHPELAGRPDTVALNAQSPGGAAELRGTAAASLAAAPANGAGLLGLYPRALLQSWDASVGGVLAGYSAAIGIEAAATHCPGVIEIGFASSELDPFVADAVLAAQHAGCLVVAPAGNAPPGGSKTMYPASLPHVLTVAATSRDDRVASFSTAGPATDLAAPGDSVLAAVPLSADPSGYGILSGTSYAAPLVAAAAAWLWTARPNLDAGQVFEVLRRSARDVGAPRWDPATGFGVLDVPAALAAHTPVRDPWEPNDDIAQVKPGELYPEGEPALTTAARASRHVVGTLDANDDPEDVYRIAVPAHHTVHVHVASGGIAAARIWGPRTLSLHEGLAARRRDLDGLSITAGARGFGAYVEVLLTGRSARGRYRLSVRAARR